MMTLNQGGGNICRGGNQLGLIHVRVGILGSPEDCSVEIGDLHDGSNKNGKDRNFCHWYTIEISCRCTGRPRAPERHLSAGNALKLAKWLA